MAEAKGTTGKPLGLSRWFEGAPGAHVLWLFLATRLTLIIIGLVARALIRPLLTHPLTSYSRSPVLDLWGVWDTRWYLDVAVNGYSTRVIGPNGETNTAFFPLYPLMVRFFGALTGDYYVAGIILSNIFLLAAGVVLYKLVALRGDGEAASASVKFLFLFPTAFILSAFFPESLFLMLSLLCFFAAKTKRWILAGCFGFLLSLTRPLGVFIVFPLAYEYLLDVRWKLRSVRPDILSLLLIPLGLSVFGAYLFLTTGRFLDFIQAPGAWGRHLGNPFGVLLQGLVSGNVHLLFGAAFALVCLLSLLIFSRKIGGPYWVLGTYSMLIPLTSGMIPLRGTARYALPIFPLYMILAEAGKRNRYLNQALTGSLAMLQGFLMVFWANRSLLVI